MIKVQRAILQGPLGGINHKNFFENYLFNNFIKISEEPMS